jgi:Protein of unknown function (DUF3277)
MPRATYSFSDISGAMTHPIAGVFLLSGGNLGMGKFTIEMTAEQTTMEATADGTVIVSAIENDIGSMTIEMNQSSALHSFLLGWYNAISTLKKLGDVTNWATASISLRAMLDGSFHTLTGVAPGKVPAKTYGAQSATISWILMAASVINE